MTDSGREVTAAIASRSRLEVLLARIAPVAASFDAQWLPSSRWHWAWFFVLLVLLLVAKLMVDTGRPALTTP